MGSAATRTAAISPAQSGLPAGVWDRNTPSATVSTRTSVRCRRPSKARSSRSTWWMKVRINSVMIGGPTHRQDDPEEDQPVSGAVELRRLLDLLLMPRKNCRRKKIANGVMKKYGRIKPGMC